MSDCDIEYLRKTLNTSKDKFKPDNQILLYAGILITLASLLLTIVMRDSSYLALQLIALIFFMIWVVTSYSQRMYHEVLVPNQEKRRLDIQESLALERYKWRTIKGLNGTKEQDWYVAEAVLRARKNNKIGQKIDDPIYDLPEWELPGPIGLSAFLDY